MDFKIITKQEPLSNDYDSTFFNEKKLSLGNYVDSESLESFPGQVSSHRQSSFKSFKLFTGSKSLNKGRRKLTSSISQDDLNNQRVLANVRAVSYTHLTLPTSDLV